MSYAVDLSTHGRELKRIYESIVTSDPDTSWAVFDYRGGATKQTLVPGATGFGSLHEFVEEFDDNKVQYGLARVEYSGVNKVVLVGWVGESVPERVKGYFNAHFSTIAKYFDGFHVQITARNSSDLSPSIILNKVDSAAGSKYSGASRTLSTKPKYRAAADGADEDDWGDAKPVVERDLPSLDKVSSAYKPTKVDLGEIRQQASQSKSEGSRGGLEGLNSGTSYKPVGKVDIQALREAGKNSKYSDTRVEKIESSYKPIGKVDIKAIREQAKKQDAHKKGPQHQEDTRKPGTHSDEPEWVKKSSRDGNGNSGNGDGDEPRFGSLADRMKAFNSGVQSARPQETPKPRIASAKAKFEKRHASGTLPLRVDESDKVSHASSGFRDFGSSGGKTPAQLWAEKQGKRDAGGRSESPSAAANGASDHDDNVSDEDVDMESARAKFANARVNDDDTGRRKVPEPVKIDDDDKPKQSFSDFTSKFAKASKEEEDDEPAAPPTLPSRGQPAPPAREEPSAPSLPPRGDDTEEESTIVAIVEEDYEADPSADDEISLAAGEKVTHIEKVDSDWWLGTNAAGDFGLFPAEYVRVISGNDRDDSPPPPAPPSRPRQPEPEPEEEEAQEELGGGAAIAEFDYVAADDDELGFREGDKITNIDFASDDWWSGEVNGRVGLFPANHVKLL